MTEPGQRGDTAVLPRRIRADQGIPGTRGARPAWFARGLEAGTATQSTAALSTAVALRLRGDLDGPALEGALRALAARFTAPGAAVPLDLGEVAGAASASLGDALDYVAQEPFDLARGPLLRVGLYRQDARDVVVLVVAHRIVTDACPMTAVICDLEALYRERAGRRPGAAASVVASSGSASSGSTVSGAEALGMAAAGATAAGATAAGAAAAGAAAASEVTCGDTVRLYRWVSGSRSSAPHRSGC